jgi:putative addiction module CopG family antidote
MILTVNPEMEKFIEEQVKAGHFNSPSEVLEAGLARLMLDPVPEEMSDRLFERIESSLEQIDRGEIVDAKELHARLLRKYLHKRS